MSASAPDTHVPHGVDVLRVYGEGFAGREAELAALDRAWNEGMVRVFVLHAEGGAGKTRVVAKWLNQVRNDGWRGAGPDFVYSFYSQGSGEQRNASSELFFEKALSRFGHTGPLLTDPTEQGRTLARLLVEHHGLLVLDGIEPLQHPPSFDQGRLKDPAIDSLLRSLAIGRIGDPSSGGLCVVTSRQPVVELQDKIGRIVVQQPLDRLDAAAGAELLRQLEVRGPDWELREAVEDAHGHAYSLMLLGSYLRDATDDHEIRRRREIPFLEEDKEHRYHARHLFGAYITHLGESSPEVAVLRLLGFFDRPAEERLLAVLREAAEPELNVLTAPLRNLSSTDWRRVLRRLTDLRLIDVPVSPSPPMDSHPLLREYFAEQLRTRFPEAWRTGHRRLFEHLCETTEHWPDTLAGLQPLYQAVVHGCLAGLHQQACDDVYIARILRGSQGYSVKKLGAVGADLGAVACFFAMPWTTLAPKLVPSAQAWLLNEAAFRLQALGRLTEAVEPMRAGLERRVLDEDWKNAAISAGNLSELELARGEMAAAVTAGEQSVMYANHSGDAPEYIVGRTTLACALHQAGRNDEAQHQFEDAESRQADFQPAFPRLYSLRGFQYCELLLSRAERATWQRWCLGSSEGSSNEETCMICIAACDAVIERARQTLEWHTRMNIDLLSTGLTQLTLARSSMYKAQFAFPILWPVDNHVTAAIDSLRASSDIEYIASGLLTRAWQRYNSGDDAGSQEDLNEAWEIAERGPMPLHQADILLYRARLFHDRDALAKARQLIEKHGYHRRDGELADTEEAAKHWKDKEPGVPTKVFVSYSHDSDLHSQRVLALSNQLRKHGVDAALDQYETRPPQGWPRWCEEQLRPENSEFVLVVCTETYLNRIEGKVPADEGRGVFWEGSVIYSYLYDQKSNARFIPILFDRSDETYIPRPFKGSYYRLMAFDLADAGYNALYRELTHQQPPRPPLGDVVKLGEGYAVRGGVRDEVVVLPPVNPKEVRSAFPVGGSAVKVWQEKLGYLLEQEAIAVDPDQKFRLRKLIEEARQRIREFGE